MSKTAQSSSTEPLWFWRETEIPFGFFSQWYPCTFSHDGTTYCSTEHWMMLQKALLFGDADIAKQIAATTNPAEHRTLGRKVKNFDNTKWNQNKFNIVEQGNYLKFTQCHTTTLPSRSGNSKGNGNGKTNQNQPSTPLKTLLLATDDRELVEASPYDRIWGIGFSAKDAPNADRATWGENLLGKAIMAVRERLRKEAAGEGDGAA